MTYAEMSKRLQTLKDEYRKLTESERESDNGKDIHLEIIALNELLNDIDKSLGQASR